MQNSTALPNLRMLPTRLLVPHEDYDPRRAEKLSRRILEEGFLKNPPVVAAIPDSECYVVLDGANRTIAFQAAGIAHIVAQLVSYDDPGVMLDTWYHVISGMELEDFEEALLDVAGMRLHDCELGQARRALETEQAAAYIVCDSGVRQVIPTESRGCSALQLLKNVVGVYRGKADIFRASNDIWEIQKPFYPEIMALVVFPRLKPQDILSAAANGEKVPSGITRHIIPTRAVNIS